ncbi:hypothetical protein N4R57_10560 [Rhodobacteraceae bacterium D3-12]|nr:hypothetical protein N4R57_10560 [Rhodobacteraceae bacterium D3-12]
MQIDSVIDAALKAGTAVQQGRYVVLGEEICSIRLPEITTKTALDAPEIKVSTTAFDQFAADGYEGCYLQDASVIFKERDPSPAGNDSFLRFYAAHILSGDLTFYGDSPLQTPPGLQVLMGDCGKVAKAKDIARSQSFITDENFAKYVRWQMAQTPCSDARGTPTAMQFTAEMQGADLTSEKKIDPPINAWLWFEFDLIAMAAGWREGMSWTAKGNLRPPLCHYVQG